MSERRPLLDAQFHTGPQLMVAIAYAVWLIALAATAMVLHDMEEGSSIAYAALAGFGIVPGVAMASVLHRDPVSKASEMTPWKALAGILICVLAILWLASWLFLLLAIPVARQDDEPWSSLLLVLGAWTLGPAIVLGTSWYAVFRGVALD